MKKGETVSPEMRARIAAALKGRKATEETKRRLRETWHERHTPERIRVRVANIRKAYANPTVKQRVSEGTRRAFKDPDVRRRHIAANRQNGQKRREWLAALPPEAIGAMMANVRAGQRYANTSIERIVESALAEAGVSFQAQFPIGRYRADFYLPDHNMIIECDGRYWHKDFDADERRDKAILAVGYHIMRLPEDCIRSGFALTLIAMLPKAGKPVVMLSRGKE